jgi:beta-glucosidase
VQVYLTDRDATVPVPICQLAGFRRIHLTPAQTKTIRFSIAPEQLSLINEDGERAIEAGSFTFAVGGCQPGYEARTAGSTQVLTGQFAIRSSRILRAL